MLEVYAKCIFGGTEKVYSLYILKEFHDPKIGYELQF